MTGHESERATVDGVPVKIGDVVWRADPNIAAVTSCRLAGHHLGMWWRVTSRARSRDQGSENRTRQGDKRSASRRKGRRAPDDSARRTAVNNTLLWVATHHRRQRLTAYTADEIKGRV